MKLILNIAMLLSSAVLNNQSFVATEAISPVPERREIK
jgi:hypothetical protein